MPRRSLFQINAIGRLKDGAFLELIKLYAGRGVEPVFREYTYNKGVGEADKIKKGEAKLLLEDIPAKAYVIALDACGELMSSEDFAKFLDTKIVKGYSRIVFIIGGAFGLHDSVIKMSNKVLSLGKMTFPHMLARVILMEQLYRTVEIWNNSPYHK